MSARDWEGMAYFLPDGLDWIRIAEYRRRWSIDARFAPLATAPNCIARGIPLPSNYRPVVTEPAE